MKHVTMGLRIAHCLILMAHKPKQLETIDLLSVYWRNVMCFFYFHNRITCTEGEMCRRCRCVGLQLQQLSLTFQLADLRLTVRPLLVTVHFILMKKSRSVLSSLPFLLKPLPETQTVTRGKLKRYHSCSTMNRCVIYNTRLTFSLMLLCMNILLSE